MKTGVSSACFYPMETLESLKLLGEHGVKNSEIFFNTFSELKPNYIKELCAVKSAYGMQTASVHPFTSGFEPFMFFTDYHGRVEDSLELYKYYFEAAQRLNAEFFVFHGDRKGSSATTELYAERYSMLYDLGQSYSVTVCQENVPRCRCSNIDFILDLKRVLGDKVAFTADFKQAIRADMDIEEMICAMGKQLKHVHISDSDAEHDCLAPSKGNADFDRLLSALMEYSSAENIIIELYSKNFSGINELVNSMSFLNLKLLSLEKKHTYK